MSDSAVVSDSAETETRSLPALVAGTLVFFTAGSVLVLEILGARLLAPYVGVTLQTYTAIIGTVLTGISLGTWGGGRLADRVPPRMSLGPILIVGGALVLLVNPAVRLFAKGAENPGPITVIAISFGALFLPAFVLSAVSPTVVKLQLSDLGRTGTVVGRLSALATAGAIVGTFLTGFVLVGTFRMSHILSVTGLFLCAIGVVVVLSALGDAGRATKSVTAVALLLAFLGFSLNEAEGGICDKETPYFCLRVLPDKDVPTGRNLVLDNLTHSFVDLADPTDMKYWYFKASAAAVDAVFTPGRPVDALSIGGGGFTLPRYLGATRPGTQNTVFEIDPGVVDVNRKALNLSATKNLHVRNVDGRIGVASLPTASQDVVIGDAFASESVPWHLTTQEFLHELDRVMRPNAVYVINVIDFAPNRLVKAETATLQTVFRHVAVLRQHAADGSVVEGNNLIVASQRELPLTGDSTGATTVLQGQALDDFIGNDRLILRDDFAPADQLITTVAEAENHR